jgi:hypothetical protein
LLKKSSIVFVRRPGNIMELRSRIKNPLPRWERVREEGVGLFFLGLARCAGEQRKIEFPHFYKGWVS